MYIALSRYLMRIRYLSGYSYESNVRDDTSVGFSLASQRIKETVKGNIFKESHMKIYIGNLSRDITEDEVRQEFAAFGSVDSVALIKDKFTGQLKGFGFVEMPVRSEAEAALAALNDKEIRGRKATVNEARPKTERPFGGDRGGGGGGRRGGGRR